MAPCHAASRDRAGVRSLMDTTTGLAIAIFLATIALVITGRIEPSAVDMLHFRI